VSHESIRTILNDCLGMKRVAARLVPKDLNFLQKLNRVRVAEDMLQWVNSNPTFIKRIGTGDKTWGLRVWDANQSTSFGMAPSNWKVWR